MCIRDRELIERFFDSAAATFEAAICSIRKQKPDRVYNFNGRFASMRAVLRACQLEKVDCFIHERGASNELYQLFVNRLPHDIDYIQDRMNQLWESAEHDPQRNQIAASWFEDRVNRVERNWKSFVKGQQANRLPDNWDSSKRNIALYCSSEDEFAAIGDCWQTNLIYPDQNQGFEQIVNSFSDSSEFHFYLRIHPSLAKVDNPSMRFLNRLHSANLSVIPADADIDTYALMRNSEKVITFGSSVGIEAVYWGVPSILVGASFYRGNSGVYQAESHEHVLELIRQDLPSLPPETALPYGFWYQTHGIPFEFYKASDFYSGKFKDHEILAVREPSMLRKVVRSGERLFKKARQAKA